MKTADIEITDGKFEYNNKTYNCKYIIKRDKENILREADESHKESFDRLYDRNTLVPIKCRAYLDTTGNISCVMIIYTVNYREGNSARLACGDYYPVGDTDNIYPHPYQSSICW